MIIAGVDYSMTSPAICVGDVNAKHEDMTYYAFGKKKMQGQIENYHIDIYPDWNSLQERYHLISEWMISIIKKHEVEYVGMEGYSFGSKGKVFNLAENMGLFKFKLWQLDIPFIEIPPTQAKKFATGKGNADKHKMYESYEENVKSDLKGLLGDTTKGIGNPVSDLIDAYYMHQFLATGLELGEFDSVADNKGTV